MKKLLISSIAALGLIGTPALAADMAVKAPPPPPPPPAYGWTGWYIGGNVGGGWGHRDVSFTANDPIAANVVPPGQSIDTKGVVGGLQLGYNWQFQPNWLLGFETDFDWSGIRGSSTAPFTALQDPYTSTVDEHIEWFGTVRGRLGWLPWNNNLLIYGTAGFAYGRVKHTGSLSEAPGHGDGVAAIPPGPSFSCGLGGTNPCFVGSSGNTATGWTAGGGVEYALWQQWSLKLEYLYVSLASKGLTETAQSVLNPGNTPASFNANFGHTNFNIVRVGLNYQFH
jgi:outer membrane immunogenic protein